MIEDLKDENIHIDVDNLSQSKKIVYNIARNYIKKEEMAKEQKQNEKADKEAQLA